MTAAMAMLRRASVASARVGRRRVGIICRCTNWVAHRVITSEALRSAVVYGLNSGVIVEARLLVAQSGVGLLTGSMRVVGHFAGADGGKK